jgi:hypothetical protein
MEVAVSFETFGNIYQIIWRHIPESSNLHSFFFFFGFLGWGETESTWYVGHYLAYRTNPG